MVDPANLPHPRFIHSACQWVVSTRNWQLQPQESLSDYILKGISEGNEDLLPWRLEGWMETNFTPPAIVYTQGVLYLVTSNSDASSNLSHFEAIEVRNTPSLSIPQNDSPRATIGNPLDLLFEMPADLDLDAEANQLIDRLAQAQARCSSSSTS